MEIFEINWTEKCPSMENDQPAGQTDSSHTTGILPQI